jgi:DNA-directed RNA polymerase II subunit RPB9
MRFCRDCNNMLYARENVSEKVLEFWCKNCQYIETVDSLDENNSCVYKNEIQLGQASVKIDGSMTNDPTFSRTKNVKCSECGHKEAIFFQNPNLDDSNMKLVFVCCGKRSNGDYCGKWWYNK